MGLILVRGNDALGINPPAGDVHLSVHGSDWLWAVAALFACSFIVFVGLTFVARAGEKIFHYLFTIALLVGSIAYFAMASDLAYDVVNQVDQLHVGATRQIFWAKYVYWVVSWPVVIIALGLISGVAWATIAYNVALSWTWAISYLVSAYTTSTYKWGFYTFGTIAWLLLAFQTLFVGGRRASDMNVVRTHHLALAGWTNLLWLLYPIAFGLSDGGNKIRVTAGFVFFGVLDLLLVPVLAFAFVGLASRWDYNRLNLAFTQYGRVPVSAGTYPEKAVATGAAPAGGPIAPQPAVATV